MVNEIGQAKEFRLGQGRHFAEEFIVRKGGEVHTYNTNEGGVLFPKFTFTGESKK